MTERSIRLQFSVRGRTIQELGAERDRAINAMFPNINPVNVAYSWDAHVDRILNGDAGVIERHWEANVEAVCKWDETE